MPPTTKPTQNLLLAALPRNEWRRWEAQLEWVAMPKGQILAEAGHGPAHVYFPTTAIVSRMYMTQSGSLFELAVIGREGMTGASLLMGKGCESTPVQTVVTHAGEGYRLKQQFVIEALAETPIVLHLMLRFTQTLITQVAQQAVCNRHHSVDHRLCQWLLTRLDRLPSLEISTTHEAIAHMLGVRREGVTAAALKLQAEGLISYARGHITILDRAGLEVRACECYAVVSKEQRRLIWPLDQAQVAEAADRHSSHANCATHIDLPRAGLQRPSATANAVPL